LARDLGRDLGVAARCVPSGPATAYETRFVSGGNLKRGAT